MAVKKNKTNSLELKYQNMFKSKISLLKKHIEQANPPLLKNCKPTVFISICNTKTRAFVCHASGDTWEQAFDRAAVKSEKILKKEMLSPHWVKADIVTFFSRLDSQLLGKAISEHKKFFFRTGIAFDENLELAFLEAELNGNKIIDYDNKTLDLCNLNMYLKMYNAPLVKSIPPDVFLFTCKGFICDETEKVYELYDSGLDYGRRKLDILDTNLTTELASTNADFFLRNVLEDGKFNYGYFPVFNKKMNNYNILRHAGTIWCLISQYRITCRQELIPLIESTIAYLAKHVVFKDENTAFLLDEDSGELRLGGNGLSIISLTEYMKEFNSNAYADLAVKLGNGILELQNSDTGEYYHVLNYPDYSPKEEYRVVYYDGEATFALAKLYSLTKDEKWLNHAIKAVDNFIAKDYTKYVDHWVAYALNEVTLYAPEEKYYTFALENAQKNLNKIYNQDTSFHTYMELLAVTFELYHRILQNAPDLEYLKKFDEKLFIKTIYKRARHQLNGYLYPEYAMYLKAPSTVARTFCVRHHSYRVRIDDIQHFIGGYFLFHKYYPLLESYRIKLDLGDL